MNGRVWARARVLGDFWAGICHMRGGRGVFASLVLTLRGDAISDVISGA